jgi:hypothetical protein
MPFTPKTRPTRYMMDQLYGTHDFKTYDDMPDFTPAPKPVKRKRTTTGETEHQLQRRIVTWFKKQYPDMKELLCYNDTNKSDATAQMISKSLGLVTGRNDLSLYYRGRALLLELKRVGQKQSDGQKQFETTQIKYGNHYRVADNFDQATEIIRNFIQWCDK